MQLLEFFDNVYLPRRLRGKSENSVRLYRLCICQFGRSLGRPARLEDLTEDNVLMHLRRRNYVSPATRNKELSQLTAMWRLASQRKLVDGWPHIQAEPEPERAPVAWLPEEVAKILKSAESFPGTVGSVDAGLWWSCKIRVLLDTGERISAIRAARWDWLSGQWLTIKAEARKGKTRDRAYRLSAETAKLLAKMRKQSRDKELIFPWPYNGNYLWNRYKRILTLAGLPADRDRKFHACRKTLASAVYAAGMDAQDALDHSDRRTTQRYLDPRLTRSQHPSEILAAYLRGDQPPPAAKKDAC